MSATQLPPAQLLADRRLLLKLLLESHAERGRTVLLPVGCNTFDDWLLDALVVERLSKQINLGGTLDLIHACSTGATLLQRHSPEKGGAGELPPVVEFKDLALGGPGPRLVVEDPRIPTLRLKSLGTLALGEHQLKELAYTIFVGCCADSASPNVMHGIRAQMEVTEARSGELQRVLALACQQGVTSLTNLEMYAKLLQVVRPPAFDSFRSFVRWREAVSSTIWLVMRQAAHDSWAPTPGPGSEAAPARMLLARRALFPSAGRGVSRISSGPGLQSASLWSAVGMHAHAHGHAVIGSSTGDRLLRALPRLALRRLAGALRRMDVRDADEYDDNEYAEAAAAAVDAASQLAQHCTSGWSFPWGLRARLAELLLRGVFDTLEEGRHVGHALELLGLLETGVWPELGISPDVHTALYAWVHYRQYAVSGEASMLERAASLLRGARPLPAAAAGQPATPGSSASGTAPPLIVTAEEAEADFPGEVLAALADSLRATLSDYRASAADPRDLKGLLAVLEAEERCRRREAAIPAILEAAVRSSVEAEFGRQADEIYATVAIEDDRVALLIGAARKLMEEEYSRFSPLLLPLQPEARMAAAATLHELVGARFLPWLINVTGLTKSALEIIRAAVALEDSLALECRDKPLPPWGTMDRLAPLLYTWAQGQVGLLASWMARNASTEDWGRLTRQRSGCGRSAVETLKMVTDTLEALFDMRLAVPPGVVRCLVEGVDGALGKYCAFAATDAGSAECLVPPRPPLTRYKRELAVAAEQAEAGAAVEAAADGVGGRLRSVRSKLESAMTASWLPPLGHTEDEARVMYTSLPSLVVRANSVQHVHDALPALRAMVVERWEGDRMESTKKADGAAALDWVTGMFDGARQAAEEARDQLCRFIAVRLVYGELRELIFERLYRFHVSTARIDPVLREVDRQLGDVCAQAHDALPPRLARATLAALAAAMQRVLTDGGPYRLFTPQDVDMLEADLAALKAMFWADGDGLGAGETDAATRGVSDLLDVMRLDTGTIVASLKQYSSGRGGGGRHAGTDPDVLLRVLCHRADHAASKYLKKDHKVPKKLPSVVTASVKELGSSVSSTVGKAGKAGGGLLRKASKK